MVASWAPVEGRLCLCPRCAAKENRPRRRATCLFCGKFRGQVSEEWRYFHRAIHSIARILLSHLHQARQLICIAAGGTAGVPSSPFYQAAARPPPNCTIFEKTPRQYRPPPCPLTKDPRAGRLRVVRARRRGRRRRHQRLQAGGQDGGLAGCRGGGAASRLGGLSLGAIGHGEHRGRHSRRPRPHVLEQQPGARLILVFIRKAGRYADTQGEARQPASPGQAGQASQISKSGQAGQVGQ